MKSYTDIEQSKKLAEILPIESADACWTNHLFNAFLSTMRIESTSPQEYKNLLDGFAVRGYLIEPAWSLAALLSMIDTVKEILYHRVTMLVGKYAGNNWYIELEKIQDERSALLVYSKELIDACYEMIVKLHEQKLL